jgi:hypothetical protein
MGIYYLVKVMMITQLSGGLFIIVNFIIWEKVMHIKTTYFIFTVRGNPDKTDFKNLNHKPMNYILKGLDKYGMTKYQSRVFNKIEKLKELRTMNKITFPFLTFIIYDQNGKTYL